MNERLCLIMLAVVSFIDNLKDYKTFDKELLESSNAIQNLLKEILNEMRRYSNMAANTTNEELVE